MKLKLDDKGNVVVQDGKPVYVSDAGNDVVFDYDQTLSTITKLNGEAKGHRERAEAAEAKLKPFDGIEDAQKARDAIELVSKLDSKKLIDAGKVDEVRAEATKAYEEKLKAQEEKYKPVVAERDNLKTSLFKEKIGGSFSRSKYIAEKLAIPSDLVEARFGTAFTIEDDRVVAKYPNGEKVFSLARPGEIADFDEALEMLVGQYPNKDQILKGSGASGGGAGGSGAGAGGKKTMTRAQFDTLPATEQMATIKGGTAVID